MVVLVVEVGRKRATVDVWVEKTNGVPMSDVSPVEIMIDVMVSGGGVLMIVDVTVNR